jgi:hypothetical protein
MKNHHSIERVKITPRLRDEPVIDMFDEGIYGKYSRWDEALPTYAPIAFENEQDAFRKYHNIPW